MATNGFFRMEGLDADIMELIGDLNGAVAEVERASPEAARESAEIIAAEQRRIFGRAVFDRLKPRHQYKFVDAGVIKVMRGKARSSRQTRFEIGFDVQTIKQYPELIVIEFGRPGKSPRYSGTEDILHRKKGKFPAKAQTAPIRTGFFMAKEKAFRHYSDALLAKASAIASRR